MRTNETGEHCLDDRVAKYNTRSERLRSVVEDVLAQTPRTTGSSLLFAALGSLINFDGPDEADDRLALHMAMTAIFALLMRDDEHRRIVRAWHAHRHDRREPDPDAFKILLIAEAVELTAVWYPHRNPGSVDTSRADVERLRAHLVNLLGAKGVASVDDLEAWIVKHSPTSSKNKLTTAGIVAKILHRGRLLGARGPDEHKTLRRVTMALKRRHFTPLVK